MYYLQTCLCSLALWILPHLTCKHDIYIISVNVTWTRSNNFYSYSHCRLAIINHQELILTQTQSPLTHLPAPGQAPPTQTESVWCTSGSLPSVCSWCCTNIIIRSQEGNAMSNLWRSAGCECVCVCVYSLIAVSILGELRVGTAKL